MHLNQWYRDARAAKNIAKKSLTCFQDKWKYSDKLTVASFPPMISSGSSVPFGFMPHGQLGSELENWIYSTFKRHGCARYI